MTTLVIGGHAGIGKRFVEMDKGIDGDIDGTWWVPSIDQLDVTNEADFSNWFVKSLRVDPIMHINRVVYCAGANMPAMLGNIDIDDVRQIFSVNVIGFINLMDCLIRFNRTYEPCSVVAIVSDAATVAMRGSISYCSSKAALAHAVRCAAREVAGHGWRVNGISPGVVEDTPMTNYLDAVIPSMRGWTEAEARKYELSMVPAGRRCTMEEVAQLMKAVLDGPEFLNGAVIPLSGAKS
jgi:NAD(P)-dependent dehydrogenase (short-subunit alcohol dehydrogenase family)